MKEPELVVARNTPDGLEIVVNFGVFSGRDATRAEVERLGDALLRDIGSVEIVCEQRYEFGAEREATVYQVRVDTPAVDEELGERLRGVVEAWARDCIAERRFLSL